MNQHSNDKKIKKENQNLENIWEWFANEELSIHLGKHENETYSLYK